MAVTNKYAYFHWLNTSLGGNPTNKYVVVTDQSGNQCYQYFLKPFNASFIVLLSISQSIIIINMKLTLTRMVLVDDVEDDLKVSSVPVQCFC